MNPVLDETHDAKVQSWVESANIAGSDFPIQNLPFGVFRRRDAGAEAGVGVAIGDRIVDVAGMRSEGLFAEKSVLVAANACASDSLNSLMALGAGPRRALRRRLHDILRQDAPASDRQAASRHLVAQSDVDMLLPAVVGDYTDFYASIFHATNVGKLFRSDNPLLPNYKYVPIGYHGRASSVVVSGTPVRRPSGQVQVGTAPPVFAPSGQLDYECELGAFVARGNVLGQPVPIEEAEDHLFGVCLVNDWSARDIQRWEYQPLGPFLSKNFATTISPWVVTFEALEPFRVPRYRRLDDDPAPLAYLDGERDRESGGIAPVRLSSAGFEKMYWTMAQMLTHHASNGCNLWPGDLLASGTVSGPEKEARGCLLELTWRGTEPLTVPTGETRTFLEDGDELILRAYAEREGARRIGLGECRGKLVP